MALFAADYLLLNYPDLLSSRYQLDSLPETSDGLLEIIGRQRGCLRAGGKVEYDKAAKLFLTEIRAGTLGHISFETPEIIETEMAELAIRQQREKEKKLARKKSRKRG
jgi:ribosome biogenesis GTPase A